MLSCAARANSRALDPGRSLRGRFFPKPDPTCSRAAVDVRPSLLAMKPLRPNGFPARVLDQFDMLRIVDQRVIDPYG